MKVYENDTSYFLIEFLRLISNFLVDHKSKGLSLVFNYLLSLTS